MTEAALQALLAFAIAGLICFLELVTSKYPRTTFLVLKCKALYAYCLIYAALAALIVQLLPVLGGQLQIEGLGAGNRWVEAVMVGVATKAFLHIRLFSVTTAPGRTFPVGFESLIALVEPWLLQTIDLHHFAEARSFLRDRVARHPDHARVLEAALAGIPPTFNPADKAAIRTDLAAAAGAEGVLGVYLSYCGRKALDSVFP